MAWGRGREGGRRGGWYGQNRRGCGWRCDVGIRVIPRAGRPYLRGLEQPQAAQSGAEDGEAGERGGRPSSPGLEVTVLHYVDLMDGGELRVGNWLPTA